MVRTACDGCVRYNQSDVTDLVEGDEFAGHRIEGVAGRGGMGVVYRARQLDLDRDVALKLIAPSLAEDDAFRDRFIAESRAAAAIDHPNVIPVYYAGEAQGRLYIAMRFVEGEDLRTRVRREGRLNPEEAAYIVNQVAAALDAAHARGLVHRDVKPANVLLDANDHAYLTDFGLTKRVNSNTGATKAGGWVGTLGYVSPEQIRGERTDARSDVYALGCVLYHAITGSTPYQRDTDEATLWSHLNDDPPSVLSAVPSAPDAFEAVVARAMAKDPADRFQSAGDLGRAALAAAGRAETVAPERVVATGPAAPPRPGDETVVSPEHAPTVQQTAALEGRRQRTGRNWRLLGAAALAFALLAGGAAALVLGNNDDETPPATTPTAKTPTTAEPERLEPRTEIPAQYRPNAILATRKYVWVLSSSKFAILITPKGVTLPKGVPVGGGATGIAAGYGRVWITKPNTRSLLIYGADTARRKGAVIKFPPPYRPVIVAAAGGSVWVGLRGPRQRPDEPGRVAKIDPATGAVTNAFDVPTGIQNLAVGAGGVWVIDGQRNGVTRYSIKTGTPAPKVRTGRGAYAAAVSNGSVWVTNTDSDRVTRIDADSRKNLGDVATGSQPQGIDVGGGSVWVANYGDGTATRVDAKTGERMGPPVAFASNAANPFAVSVNGHTAWMTLLGRGAVAPIDF